jgi:(1->4)-alpha-D-glucan 1-alpha-D-glucosylmutase
MWTIHKALELRRERPECFGAEAEYTPLEVDGPKHDHTIAYLRGEDVVTVVPRLTLKLDGSWKDTIVVLPKGRWRNRLTGGAVDGGVITMKLLLKDFPLALLVREDVGEQD